jgi:hypothetical protein
MSTTHDRWMLPRRQTELPTREIVSEERLHGRREATFLSLATLLAIATAAIVALAAARSIDLTAALAYALPHVDVPLALRLPIGAIPLALGLAALALARDLYGGRRARALGLASAFAATALLVLMRVADAAIAPALALAIGWMVAVVVHLVALARLHAAPPWLRWTLAATVAQLWGWATFAAVACALDADGRDTFFALSLGASLYGAACALVLALPFAVISRGLRVYLRVARGPEVESRPSMSSGAPTAIVDDYEPPRARVPMPAFSPDELAFFRDGDRLAEGSAQVTS